MPSNKCQVHLAEVFFLNATMERPYIIRDDVAKFIKYYLHKSVALF